MGDSITTCTITEATNYEKNQDKTIAENTAETSQRLMDEIKKNNPELPENDFNDKLQEIEEFLGKRIAQKDFLQDNLPLPTIQSIVIEQINSLLHNGTKNHSPIEINTRTGIKILRDNDKDFSIKYHGEANDKGEPSKKIRFNYRLHKGARDQKYVDLSYNITNNEIEIDGKRYSLTEEQGKTMLNAISQMITATKNEYEKRLRDINLTKH